MTPDHPPLGVAVVGYGYWGPNVVRNIVECPGLELRALSEEDTVRAAAFAGRYPGIPSGVPFDTVLEDPLVEAVAVVTPPRTHYALVRAALEAGKNVLVEKPLATSVPEAEELVELAERRGLVLMPGHTFLYSPAVNKVKQLIAAGDLGDVYFVTSSRMNLGVYQPDGVVLDLAPHDLSILQYWFERPIEAVTAAGCTVFQDGVPETAFLTVEFSGGVTANLQLSWLAPRKVRQMVIVGSKRMVQYDDNAPDDAIRVYDRGLDLGQPATYGEYKMTYRSGDMVAPRLEALEPLGLEVADFAAAMREGRLPRSHARLGLEVVRALEAANASLQAYGERIRIVRWPRHQEVPVAPDETATGTPPFMPWLPEGGDHARFVRRSPALTARFNEPVLGTNGTHSAA
jgi:predicted dehydrogenase